MRGIITNFIIVLFCLTAKAQAEMDSLRIILDEVEIHSNRIKLNFAETSGSVEVISRAEIEQSPVQSVAELLHYTAGVDIRQRGVNGVQADVSIRGGTFDQVLILLNGVKISDPQTGHHSLNLPVDIESIERIEILKGPGARIYGQNAFSGAINIVTKLPDERYSAVQITAGEHALGGVRVSASLPNSNFKQYLSFSRQFSEGYKHNTDYNINTLFYQNQFKFVNNEMNIVAGLSEREFGANGFYASPEFTEQYEEVQTSLVSLEMKHVANKLVTKPRIYWRRNQDEYHFVRSNPSLFRNLHISQTFGLDWNNTYYSDWGTTGFGLDLHTVRLQSNNLGWHQRYVAGMFLEHRFEFGNFDATPGIAAYYYSDFGPKIFPGLDVGYSLSSNSKIYGNVGYTWRIPSFTDLYYVGPQNLGNPDLDPESAIAYELGFKHNFNGVQTQVSGYFRNASQLIDWAKPTSLDTLWQPLNYNNLNTSGIEFSVNAALPTWFGADFFIKRVSLSYSYINAEQQDLDVVASRYVLDNLRHQLTLGLEWKIVANLHNSIRFRYADRVTEAIGDYTLLDSRLSWLGKVASIYVEGTNILDTEYKETNLVTMPGRWLRAGINFKFKY